MQIVEYLVRVPGVGRYNLYPVGDIQKDAPGFDESLFAQLKAEIQNDSFPIVIGMGDYEDNFRPKVRMKIDTMTSDDKDFRSVMDKEANQRLDDIRDFLMPIFKPKRGFCLGLLKGHHLYEFADGINSVQKMCGTFGCKYLDEMAFIRLKFYTGKDNGNGDHRWSLVIHAQHGDGGAGFSGPDMANLERKTVPYWNADLFLRGHSTKRWAAPFTEFRLSIYTPLRLEQQTKWAVNTGGFMRGHLQGESTYVSRRNLPPANLGYTIVSVDLKRHKPNISKINKVNQHEMNLSVTLR